jgi:hypothetical protein
MEPNLEADVLAATLYQGLKESQDLLEFLARKFEGPLSQLLTVRRKGGLFAKEHPVEEITLRFAERHFQIVREPRGFFVPKILKEVRGVVLKTTQVTVEDWLSQLAEELAKQAQLSESSRSALSRFLME